jgi:hypothetical protein
MSRERFGRTMASHCSIALLESAANDPKVESVPVRNTCVTRRFGSWRVTLFDGAIRIPEFPVDHGDLIVRLVTWAMKGTDEASAD